MANILAAQTGNWSSTATWTGGVLPGVNDIAVANGKTITIDQDISVTALCQNTTGGAVQGGWFVVSSIPTTRTLSVSAGIGGAYCLTATTAGTTSLLIVSATSGNLILGDVLGATTAFITYSQAVLISGSNLNITVNNCYAGASNSGSGFTLSGTSNTATVAAAYGTGVSKSNNFSNVNNSGIYYSGTSCILYLTLASGDVGTSAGGGYPLNAQTPLSSITYCTNATAGNMMGINAGSAAVIDITGTATASATQAGLVSISPNNRVKSFTDATNGRKAVYAATWIAPYSAQVTHRVYCETIPSIPYVISTPTAQVTLTNYITNTPPPSDVRAGKTYGANNDLVGTLAVPATSKVSVGTAVDNTIGTAVLLPTDVWGYAIATGVAAKDRLLATATIDSTGAQIAANAI